MEVDKEYILRRIKGIFYDWAEIPVEVINLETKLDELNLIKDDKDIVFSVIHQEFDLDEKKLDKCKTIQDLINEILNTRKSEVHLILKEGVK